MGALPLLTVLRNGEKIKEFPVDRDAVVGRSDDCVIRLPDRAISREHAVFRKSGDGVEVQRKSDFAPLSVNGVDCTAAILKEGDIVTIGPYAIKLTFPKKKQVSAQNFDAALRDTADLTQVGNPSSSPGQPSSGHAPSVVENSPPIDLAFKAGASGGNDPFGPVEMQMPGDLNITDNAAHDLGVGGVELSEQGAVDIPDFSSQPEQPVSSYAPPPEPVQTDYPEDANTRVGSMSEVKSILSFPAGAANVKDYEIRSDSVTIGRGKNCDIVLTDKKASRKHSIIKKTSDGFVIRDMESANGTHLNGERIKEASLSGDDVIRIGDTDFGFRTVSADFEKNQKNYLVPMEDPSEDLVGAENDPALDLINGNQPLEEGPPASSVAPIGDGVFLQEGGEPLGSDSGLAGVAGLEALQPKTGFAAFRSWFVQNRMKVLLVIVGILLWTLYMEDDPKTPQKKTRENVVVKKGDKAKVEQKKTFEKLSKEQQEFVKNQRNMAFDYYKNQKYDEAIFAIQKVFQLVSDWEDAKEIERYALEGKQVLERQRLERERREEEVRIRAKVNSLVKEVEALMKKKNYDSAQHLFPQILNLDPENKLVPKWQHEIEEYQNELKRRAEEEEARREANKKGWQKFANADKLRNTGDCLGAIDAFSDVLKIDVSDQKIYRLAKARISECRRIIRNQIEPVLAEAKAAEAAGEPSRAYKFYLKATRIDPLDPVGFEGMARIRDTLHERAKITYTEAVLMESFGEFVKARQKFNDTLDVAPIDDIYFERAQSKLKKYQPYQLGDK